MTSRPTPIIDNALSIIQKFVESFEPANVESAIQISIGILAILLSAPVYEKIRLYFEKLDFKVVKNVKFPRNDSPYWIVSVLNNSKSMQNAHLTFNFDHDAWNNNFQISVDDNSARWIGPTIIKNNEIKIEKLLPKRQINLTIKATNVNNLYIFRDLKHISPKISINYNFDKRYLNQFAKNQVTISFSRLVLIAFYVFIFVLIIIGRLFQLYFTQ